MTMDTLLVLLVVLAAAAYLGRKIWRTMRAGDGEGSGCASGCGCGSSGASTPASPPRGTR